MFVVDLIAASLLTFVLTVAFTAVVRHQRYRKVSDISGGAWLMTLASWVGGVFVISFGLSVTGTHWLPFAVAGFVIGLLVLTLPAFPRFRSLANKQTSAPGADAQPVIVMYFFVTLLLFLCALSLRFYVMNLM